MIVYPAIDIRRGRCVRLYRGDPSAETVYGDDPVAMAERWVAEGAEWLHVVNLDGALEEESDTPKAVQAIVRTVSIPVQVGGGLRTLDDMAAALDWGVARIILGTVAVREPELVEEAIRRFGAERVVVGIDARDGKVAIRGWKEQSELSALELAARMKALGVERLVYTDISRDGMLEGPNVARTGELAQQSGLRVIASGGVGSLDHLRQLRWIEPFGVDGVIVGQALYTGAVSLPAARRLLESEVPLSDAEAMQQG